MTLEIKRLKRAEFNNFLAQWKPEANYEYQNQKTNKALFSQIQVHWKPVARYEVYNQNTKNIHLMAFRYTRNLMASNRFTIQTTTMHDATSFRFPEDVSYFLSIVITDQPLHMLQSNLALKVG